MPQQNNITLTEIQVRAISDLYLGLDKDALKEQFGVRRFRVLEAAIAKIEAPVFNDGKAMHERGRPATDPYTLPLEARTRRDLSTSTDKSDIHRP